MVSAKQMKLKQQQTATKISNMCNEVCCPFGSRTA